MSTHEPQDCTLLIGIPSKMKDYDLYKEGLLESDFLKRCCSNRLKFFNEVVEPVQQALPNIKKYGCHVVQTVREEDFVQAFDKKVVIVFSHWDQNNLEVNGRMIPDNLFCQYIPTGYSGIIDICACQPEDHLVVCIKNRAPAATIKCTLTKITPAFWIEIIELTLLLLRRYKLNYREASMQVITQIFNRYHKKRQNHEQFA
ncbi:MAG TPA: hypothetical protein VMR70_09005 [Flavisolibacter sp.]|nr:hypothetical protein [Flavisolibacter sp.]